jgi:hypothetical protein
MRADAHRIVAANAARQGARGSNLPEHDSRRLRYGDGRPVSTIGGHGRALEIHALEIVELWRAFDALVQRVGDGVANKNADVPAVNGPGPRTDVGGPSVGNDASESHEVGPVEKIV